MAASLNEQALGGRVAVFIGAERVSAWAPIMSDGSSGEMRMTRGGADPWLHVESADGELIWRGAAFPGPPFFVGAAGDELTFTGFTVNEAQPGGFAYDMLQLDDVGPTESTLTFATDAPDEAMRLLLTGWPFKYGPGGWSPPAVAYYGPWDNDDEGDV